MASTSATHASLGKPKKKKDDFIFSGSSSEDEIILQTKNSSSESLISDSSDEKNIKKRKTDKRRYKNGFENTAEFKELLMYDSEDQDNTVINPKGLTLSGSFFDSKSVKLDALTTNHYKKVKKFKGKKVKRRIAKKKSD